MNFGTRYHALNFKFTFYDADMRIFAAVTTDSMTLKDWFPLICVVVGSVMGGTGAFLGNYFSKLRELKTERKSLAFAFLGEISAIRTIVEKRQYIEFLHKLIEHIKTTGENRIPIIPVQLNYFNVFNANVGKIGLLEAPLSQMIVTFYSQANSILEDLREMREGRLNNYPIQDTLATLTRLLQLFEDTKGLGEKIIQEINSKYK